MDIQFLFFFFQSCSNSIKSLKSAFLWLGAVTNDVSKTRRVEDIKFLNIFSSFSVIDYRGPLRHLFLLGSFTLYREVNIILKTMWAFQIKYAFLQYSLLASCYDSLFNIKVILSKMWNTTFYLLWSFVI